MPIAEIRLQPGLDIETTPTYNSAGFNDMNDGRFRAGMFEKIGGWSKYVPFALGGTCRQLHAWQDLNQVKRLACGTTAEFDVITEGLTVQSITPQQVFTNPTPDFSTTNGSTTVEIVDPNITNVTSDDTVEFLVPITVGGIILSGIYPIDARTGTHSYTITARAPATATVSNGGAVPVFNTTADSNALSVTLANHAQVATNIVVFPIPTSIGGVNFQGKTTVTTVTSSSVFVVPLPSSAVTTATVSMNGGNAGFRYWIAVGPSGAGLGYGLGGYGLGGYGMGGGGGTNQLGTPLQVDDWSIDNWGEILLATPLDLGLFQWQPTGGFVTLKLVPEAPAYNRGMMVSQALQQVIVYGTSLNAWDPVNQLSGVAGIGIYQDPLLIANCDISDFTIWDASSENQARNFRIPTGSEIVGASASKNRNLFWTDLELWAGIYTGQQFIYSYNKVGEKCGLIAKHAWTSFGDAAYWMGKSNFFGYAGSGVQPIPCTVWDAVFQDLDSNFASLCNAGSNTDFTEVWFFYPSASKAFGYPDKAAVYNIVEGVWYIENIDRSAWIDRSILGNPIAVQSSSGLIYLHESGYNADTVPLNPGFTSGFFYLDDSESIVTVDRIIPDFRWGTYKGAENAQIFITLFYVDTPGEIPKQSGPYLVTKQTKYVPLDPPFKARQVMVNVQSSDKSSFWRQGLLRFRYAKAGRLIPGAVQVS